MPPGAPAACRSRRLSPASGRGGCPSPRPLPQGESQKCRRCSGRPQVAGVRGGGGQLAELARERVRERAAPPARRRCPANRSSNRSAEIGMLPSMSGGRSVRPGQLVLDARDDRSARSPSTASAPAASSRAASRPAACARPASASATRTRNTARRPPRSRPPAPPLGRVGADAAIPGRASAARGAARERGAHLVQATKSSAATTNSSLPRPRPGTAAGRRSVELRRHLSPRWAPQSQSM